MNVIALNGSPKRNNGNTALILNPLPLSGYYQKGSALISIFSLTQRAISFFAKNKLMQPFSLRLKEYIDVISPYPSNF